MGPLNLRDRKRRRLAALRRISFLSACTSAELRRIDRLGAVVRRPGGEVLVERGLVGRECLVVLSGSVAVSRSEQMLAVLGPGALIGEMALLTGAPRNATVMALSDVELLVLHRGEFAQLLAIPRVGQAIRATASARSEPTRATAR